MSFLKLLEGIRTPFLDGLFSVITLLGEQTIFMILVMSVLWCIDKKKGYRLFIMGMIGNAANQLLKAIFTIPRPWVLDKSFTIVESAREAATGYSFPSGHTQSAVVSYLGPYALFKKKWMLPVSIALILLTGFSRMYLGVHTPLDVGVSLATGVLIVLGCSALFDRFDEKADGILVISGVVFSVVLLLYVAFAPKTDANVAEFDEHGIKNAWTIVGSMSALCISWFVDRRWIKYEIKAVWWAQILKVAIGLALIIGVRMLLKEPLYALLNDSYAADGIRYFIMTAVGGMLWPLTFPLFAKLGAGKGASHAKA